MISRPACTSRRSKISGSYPRVCAGTSTTAAVVTTVMAAVMAAVVTTMVAAVMMTATVMTSTAGASHGVVPLGVCQHQRDHGWSRQCELAA